MNKKQFIKLAFELGYTCQYSGRNKRFYLTPCHDFEYIAGDAEYFNEIEQQLRDSQFNLYFKAK